jgi:hypothetical protein
MTRSFHTRFYTRFRKYVTTVANRSVVSDDGSAMRDRASRLNGTTKPACSRLLKKIAFARVGRPDDDSISLGTSNEPHQGAYARRRPPPIPSTDIVAFGASATVACANESRSIRWLSFFWQLNQAPFGSNARCSHRPSRTAHHLGAACA